MKIGIFVNTDRHFADVIGLSKAAVAKGHEVILFNMDDGTKVLHNPGFQELCRIKGVSSSFCDHSAKHLGVSSEGLPQEIICGSQYNNAVMMHDTDRVIVL